MRCRYHDTLSAKQIMPIFFQPVIQCVYEIDHAPQRHIPVVCRLVFIETKVHINDVRRVIPYGKRHPFLQLNNLYHLRICKGLSVQCIVDLQCISFVLHQHREYIAFVLPVFFHGILLSWMGIPERTYCPINIFKDSCCKCDWKSMDSFLDI